jgi:hypothetical protein
MTKPHALLQPLPLLLVTCTLVLAVTACKRTAPATTDAGSAPAPTTSASAKPVDVDGILGRHRSKIAPIVADVDKLLKTKLPPKPPKSAGTADGLVYKGKYDPANNAVVVELADAAWPTKIEPFSICKEALEKRYVVEIYGEEKLAECERVRFVVLYRLYNHKPASLTGETEGGHRTYKPGTQDVDAWVYSVRGAKAVSGFTFRASNRDTFDVEKGGTPDFEADLRSRTNDGLASTMKTAAKATAFQIY